MSQVGNKGLAFSLLVGRNWGIKNGKRWQGAKFYFGGARKGDGYKKGSGTETICWSKRALIETSYQRRVARVGVDTLYVGTIDSRVMSS